jgi:hypothetical protein
VDWLGWAYDIITMLSTESNSLAAASTDFLGGSSGAVLVARLDGCHSCGGVGSAKALEIYPTGGKQTVDAAFEVT